MQGDRLRIGKVKGHGQIVTKIAEGATGDFATSQHGNIS
jgi:hypothetical protein